MVSAVHLSSLGVTHDFPRLRRQDPKPIYDEAAPQAAFFPFHHHLTTYQQHNMVRNEQLIFNEVPTGVPVPGQVSTLHSLSFFVLFGVASHCRAFKRVGIQTGVVCITRSLLIAFFVCHRP